MLLMASFYTLHDVEAGGETEEAGKMERGSASATVDLDEPRAQVCLGAVNGEQEQRWYLDSGASNHMTGSRGRSPSSTAASLARSSSAMVLGW